MQDTSPSRFEKRPGLTLALVLVGLAVFGVAAAELLLRATLDYHIDYYAGTTRPGSVAYPYGTILVNAHGQPDVEWDLDDPRPRVGFYGDSVTYGVGAGHGYRISDLVGDAHPELQVMTFAAVGARLKDPSRVAELAGRFGLERLVYLMNLNDLTPDPPRRRPRPASATPPAPDAEPSVPGPPDRALGPEDDRPAASPADEGESWVRRTRAFVREYLDPLRTRSYLYNFLRLRVKNLLVRMGYEASGFRAVELEPGEHPQVFDATAARVNDAAERLREQGVRTCVVVLPYEMQVSEEAEARYRELGVPFEDDFVAGRTQREILARLDPAFEAADARSAFLDLAAPEIGRRENALGTYFVYDRGDKIDWNHPTRAGHQRIAEWLLREGFCGL